MKRFDAHGFASSSFVATGPGPMGTLGAGWAAEDTDAEPTRDPSPTDPTIALGCVYFPIRKPAPAIATHVRATAIPSHFAFWDAACEAVLRSGTPGMLGCAGWNGSI